MSVQKAILSRSPEETLHLGKLWGRTAQAGWVLGLSGDLGAGKTQLVKGLVQGLGYTGKVQSPTFALINEYRGGRLPVFHLDLYRLETPEQIIGAGLESFFYNPPGITIVEWIERWIDATDKQTMQHFRLVKIETLNELERRISYEDFGA